MSDGRDGILKNIMSMCLVCLVSRDSQSRRSSIDDMLLVIIYLLVTDLDALFFSGPFPACGGTHGYRGSIWWNSILDSSGG